MPTPATSGNIEGNDSMDDALAPYACDECRDRKVQCSRDRAGCERCKDGRRTCNYSRSGIIRRNRKRKRDQAVVDHGTTSTERSDFESRHVEDQSTTNGTAATIENNGFQPQLAADIDNTRDRLEGMVDKEHQTIAALSSLSDTYAAVWQDSNILDRMSKSVESQFFCFEERAVEWVDAFIALLEQGRPFTTPAPPEVLDQLRAARPYQVQDRAWLVMFYSVILSIESAKSPPDERVKARLKCNLWLSLNDVRLLLEPSDVKIQALFLLACHVEEFTTPSLCWMLITNACRMLQALGITHRRLDPETRERRSVLFWQLNIVDKGLALIFCRPPTFHRAMTREIPLPKLNQLLSFQPHWRDGAAMGLFGAHYMHQLHLVTRVMGDVWYCLHEQGPDVTSIGAVMQDLDSWQRTAKESLDAAAFAEKPFLDAAAIRSIDLGLINIRFQYLFLSIILTRSLSELRPQCIDLSQEMLKLLNQMVSHSEEPYNGLIWVLLCCPFTPFLILFREILSKGEKPDLEQKKQALEAMEHVPVFLQKMSAQNSLAGKLESIAVVFVQHARSIVSRQENEGSAANDNLPLLPTEFDQANKENADMFNWDPSSLGLLNMATTTWMADDLTNYSDWNFDSSTWTNDYFVDSMFDSLILDGQPG